MRTRKLTASQKKTVAGNQNFKCANILGSSFQSKYDFECILWSNPKRLGAFGKEGYEIDHIIEFAEGGADSIENCQALCLSCHRVKTQQYTQAKRKRNYKLPKVGNTSILSRCMGMFRFKVFPR